jgi:hypothetical protein
MHYELGMHNREARQLVLGALVTSPMDATVVGL